MSLNLDKSTWTRVSFGDVVNNVNQTVRDAKAAGIDRIIAMEHMDRSELKIQRWGDADDGTTFTRRVTPGQTLFGKRRAYQRKVAYAEFDAICSGDIYTFEADEAQLLPEFLPFLVQSNEFFDHALDTSAGSLSPRTNWRDLANFEFDLPPLEEQKRIASLLWAVEHHRRALAAHLKSETEALRQLLRTRFEDAVGEVFKVADLCSSVVGGIWGLPEGKNEVDVLALGPRVYAADATVLSAAGSPIRSITRKQADSRLIREGDIILERSGGSPKQPVGRVVIAGNALQSCIPTDFQRLLRPDTDLVEPTYLFWRLRLDWLEGLTRNYSRRTTNITNLAVPDYLARQIIVPPREEQMRMLGDVKTLEMALNDRALEMASFESVRSALAADIFGDN
ncbi:restriction endonuclease subunit S [Demequina oxidasica]|uniref:restriction endonuclease subunit S n=1 Tax=Demequina oxidasica TaxID=676199 RepID=UPI000783496A|nr:restriction endonuclease subunit S [Demequina oxidasica]